MYQETFKPGDIVEVRIEPNPEYTCPHCDWIIGSDIPKETLSRPARIICDARGEEVECSHCEGVYTMGPGMFGVEALDAPATMAAPYTWLHPMTQTEALLMMLGMN